MDKINNTNVKEFILVGLSENAAYQPLLFLVFFCIYIITLSGNLCMIIAYNVNAKLHTPMYFNLANFAFSEMCYVTAIVPKMLENFLAEHKTITFYGCAIQMYFAFLFAGVECYLLAAMAFDRYSAICHPLSYITIMSRRTCLQLLVGSWSLSGVNALIHNVLTFTLTFCGRNTINHFFCDVPPVLELACTSTWINEIVLFIGGGCVLVSSVVIITISYARIISTILNIKSSSGRKKAFSTCTSHFTVVAIFYGSAIFMYFRPKSSYSMHQDSLASLMYTVIAPLLNPFIYSLRNKDVRLALVQIINSLKEGLVGIILQIRLTMKK